MRRKAFDQAFEASMKDPSKGDLNRGTQCVQALHGTACVCA